MPWAAPPEQGSSLLELVVDPVFPLALLLRGPRMLTAPPRKGGQEAKPTAHARVAGHTCACVFVHVCACSRLLEDGPAGGPGLWDTGHTLLWDCSCPAPSRAVGSDQPCPAGAQGLLGETEARQEGTWQGARDLAWMGATHTWH